MNQSKFGETGYIKLLLVLLLAAVPRYALITFAYLHGYNPLSRRADQLQYHILASNLLEKHRHSLEGWVAVEGWENQSFWERNRTPVFPFFIAAVYKIAGPKPYAASLVMVLVSCCTVLLVYTVSKQVFGQRIGLLAGTLFALSPTSVLYAGSMFPDTLHAAIVTAGYWALLKALNNRRYGLYALGGALLGLAGLMRLSTLYLALCTSLLIVWLQREWKAALLVAMLAWAVALPWAVRNLLVHGHFEVSSIGSYNMLYYNLAQARSRATGVPALRIKNLYAAQELSGVSRKALIEQETRKYWKQLLINQIEGSIAFWFVPDRTYWVELLSGSYPGTRKELWISGFLAGVPSYLKMPGAMFALVAVALNVIIAFFGFWGILASFKQKTQIHATALGCLFFLFYSLSTGAVAWGRYRLQVEPILMVFAAKGLERFSAFRRRKNHRVEAVQPQKQQGVSPKQ
jgi:4-amino-4-deoxy-L-arabinose transferase-like glycosyltransferase